MILTKAELFLCLMLMLYYFYCSFPPSILLLLTILLPSAPTFCPTSAMFLPKTTPFQLQTESDFDQIVSDGFVSICDYASLLSERSARSMFPNLINFRLAKLSGFRRVFAHVAPIFFELGIAKPETKEISKLSVEPCESESLVVATFEILRSEIPSFIEREQEFRFWLYYVPVTVMKNTCVLAGQNLHHIAYDNFLDHTFLGDRKTTIREYLQTTGSGIMEEEPPQQLKHIFGCLT
ncbi:hypothetical protein Sango_0557900 [Sesamum angolense]|uniref:Uncharacterized protein n=1 Tax=Sesamum angolense TaxID=2727404 RepID=A0AAE2C1F2_9LAMI|nr:hypothetical protein Sango_0557900 [Sesamum angolense]